MTWIPIHEPFQDGQDVLIQAGLGLDRDPLRNAEKGLGVLDCTGAGSALFPTPSRRRFAPPVATNSTSGSITSWMRAA
jgi:hypothetical protein